MTPTHDPLHGEDDQLWLGWKWFEYHSKQRLEAFKFYITIYGALVAFSATFFQTATIYIPLILSVFSIFVCVTFWQLDVRSRQLIEIGEAVIGKRWDELKFPHDLNPVSAALQVRQGGLRYKHAFFMAFAGGLLFSIVLFGSSVYVITYHVDIAPVRVH